MATLERYNSCEQLKASDTAKVKANPPAVNEGQHLFKEFIELLRRSSIRKAYELKKANGGSGQ